MKIGIDIDIDPNVYEVPYVTYMNLTGNICPHAYPDL